jgi:hypothetical protein
MDKAWTRSRRFWAQDKVADREEHGPDVLDLGSARSTCAGPRQTFWKGSLYRAVRFSCERRVSNLQTTPALEGDLRIRTSQFTFENGKIVKATANDTERFNKQLEH